LSLPHKNAKNAFVAPKTNPRQPRPAARQTRATNSPESFTAKKKQNKKRKSFAAEIKSPPFRAIKSRSLMIKIVEKKRKNLGLIFDR